MTTQNDVQTLINGTMAEKLEVCERVTRARLLFLLDSTEVPGALEYIVTDVTSARYNRIGAEGISRSEQEGLINTFHDSDFDAYTKDINEYRDRHGKWGTLLLL